MTHSLTYTGLSPSALLAAAKYDPPSADLVKALSDAVGESNTDWESEIEFLQDDIIRLEGKVADLECENFDLKGMLTQLTSNGDYE